MKKIKLPELWHVIAWIICFIAFPRETSVVFVFLMICFGLSWLHRRTRREPEHKPPPF